MLFTEALKPSSLKLSIEQDLADSRSAFVGVMHTTFSLPLMALQVGKEEFLLECAQTVEAELKERNKSMENPQLRKSLAKEGFCKVFRFLGRDWKVRKVGAT